jgi:hypothetical protein
MNRIITGYTNSKPIGVKAELFFVNAATKMVLGVITTNSDDLNSIPTMIGDLVVSYWNENPGFDPKTIIKNRGGAISTVDFIQPDVSETEWNDAIQTSPEGPKLPKLISGPESIEKSFLPPENDEAMVYFVVRKDGTVGIYKYFAKDPFFANAVAKMQRLQRFEPPKIEGQSVSLKCWLKSTVENKKQ